MRLRTINFSAVILLLIIGYSKSFAGQEFGTITLPLGMVEVQSAGSKN